MARQIVGIALALSLVGGCSWNESKVELRSSCFDACRGTATEAEVGAQLEIAGRVQATFGDLEGLGVRFLDAGGSLTSIIEQAVKGSLSAPGGFVYQGKGVYRAYPTPESRVDVTYYLPFDTSYGKAGQAITFDVFDPQSYFQGVTFKAKTSVGTGGISASVQAEFSKAGPGAELLGLGPSPSSPATLDLGAIADALAKVRVGAEMSVHHVDGPTTVQLDLHVAPLPVSSLVNQPRFPVVLDSLSGTRPDIGQTLKVASSSLTFDLGSDAALDGSMLIDSVSARFSFRFLFSFPNSAVPDVAFGCAGAKLTIP